LDVENKLDELKGYTRKLENKVIEQAKIMGIGLKWNLDESVT